MKPPVNPPDGTVIGVDGTAIVVAAGLDEAGNQLGRIIINGHEYPPKQLISLLAHRNWRPPS